MAVRVLAFDGVRARLHRALLAAAAIAASTAGCRTPGRPHQPPPPQPPRAIWVTRWDYRTARDVRQIMANCKTLGLNTVFFQVRGNGTVFYRSRIEPWAEQFGYKDPGFDPLAVAIQEAHRRGMELHAWVNVMPGWVGRSAPNHPQQLYLAHPDWFLFDQRGRRQPLNGHYVLLNPCLPAVRRYLVRLFAELCAGYELDGLHLDYIRFLRPPRPDVDYPRDRRTLALFRRATGKTPVSDPEAWNEWRRAAVTKLVAGVSAMLRRIRPNAKLTAAVVGERTAAYEALFQDTERWLAEGLIDAAVPMIYTQSPSRFARLARDWHAHSHGRPIVPGIGVAGHKNDADSIRQLRMAEAWGQGFCLFAYNAFFATPRESDLSAAQLRQVVARRRRRLERLRPVLQAMARRAGAGTRLAAALGEPDRP